MLWLAQSVADVTSGAAGGTTLSSKDEVVGAIISTLGVFLIAAVKGWLKHRKLLSAVIAGIHASDNDEARALVKKVSVKMGTEDTLKPFVTKITTNVKIKKLIEEVMNEEGNDETPK
jgi:hypothetical protein